MFLGPEVPECAPCSFDLGCKVFWGRNLAQGHHVRSGRWSLCLLAIVI